MIHEALKFIVGELNDYLFAKFGVAGLVQRGRLVKRDGTEVTTTNKVICQLINIEEERIGKPQVPVSAPVGAGFPVRNPDLHLNLTIMFTAFSPELADAATEDDDEYETATRMLSYVIQFFQFRHYFTTENSPALPASIGTLVAELYSISLENQNYLWAALGAKYRPSVVYRLRMLSIYEDAFSEIVGKPSVLNANTSR